MKKLILLLLSTILFLSACGGFKTDNSKSSNKSNDDEKVVLNFWTFWGSEERRPVIDKIVNDFNESQDEIEVKHTYVPWGDIWTKNLAAIAAGNPPDVIINDINSVKLRAEKGQIEPITDFVDKSVTDQFYPQMMDAAKKDDEIYALPFNSDTQILFYHDDQLKEAGFNQAPDTWDDMTAYADELDIPNENGKGFDRIGFYPLIGPGADLWISNALGDNYVNKDGKISVMDPKVHDAFEWIIDSQQKYGKKNLDSVNARFENAQQDPFMAGDISMMVQNANYYVELRNYAKDLDFKVAPLPEKTVGSGHNSVGGGFVAEVPKGAKNPEASYKFIEYLTGHDAQLYWAENNFDLVANKEAGEAAAESDSFNEKDKEVYNMMVENMDDTILAVQPIGAPDYKNSIDPIFERIINGTISIDEGLQQADEELKRQFEK